MTETYQFGLPLVASGQAQKHVTVNEALARLDAVAQLRVVDDSLATPPGSAVDGQAWIVASGATDAWSGHEAEIALFANGGWVFIMPKTGWSAWVETAGARTEFSGSGCERCLNAYACLGGKPCRRQRAHLDPCWAGAREHGCVRGQWAGYRRLWWDSVELEPGCRWVDQSIWQRAGHGAKFVCTWPDGCAGHILFIGGSFVDCRWREFLRWRDFGRCAWHRTSTACSGLTFMRSWVERLRWRWFRTVGPKEQRVVRFVRTFHLKP